MDQRVAESWQLFFPSGAPVLALPQWRRPRLYVPAGRMGQRWTGSSFYPAFRGSARVFRMAMRCQAALGIGTRRLSAGREGLVAFLNGHLEGVRDTVVLVGTEGPGQKLIVRLRGRDGNILAYLKYADRPRARELVMKEAGILRALPEGVGPRCLACGALGPGTALLISPLKGSMLHPYLPVPRDLSAWAERLFGSDRFEVDDHPALLRLRSSCCGKAVLRVPAGNRLGQASPSKRIGNPLEGEARLSHFPQQELCSGGHGEIIEGLLEPLRNRTWPLVIQHGDLAPWNLFRLPDGGLAAVDWEQGSKEGFPYIDLAYFVLQVAMLMHKWPPEKAAGHAAAYLTGLGLIETQARSLVRWAALDAFCRAVDDGSGQESRIQNWRRAVWEAGA